MTRISLDQANQIITAAFAKGKELGLKPLSVAVLDAGAHLTAFQRQDGSSNLRLQIATGKAAGALGMGMSSRKIGDVAAERPSFVAALGAIAPTGLVPAAGGVNSNIKDMTLWMLAQMGQMPAVLDRRLLETIHAPLVKTPTERGRLRQYLERLETAWYGYGWRSYDYSGHRMVGHRGGINGYRSLILFDPKLKTGVVALWNSNSSQPGGLEFEVMDMAYRLPFRDWLKLDSKGGRVIAAVLEEPESGSGEPRRT